MSGVMPTQCEMLMLRSPEEFAPPTKIFMYTEKSLEDSYEHVRFEGSSSSSLSFSSTPLNEIVYCP